MHASARQRTLSALAAFAVVAGGALALISAFAVRLPSRAIPETLETIVTAPVVPREPEPAPKPQPEEPNSSARGDPSPPNLRNEAAPAAAPTPRLPPLIESPPVIAASEPGTGYAASSGASDRAGPGRGAGGSGDGSGSGGSGGYGSGGYGSGKGFERPATLPRQTRGRLHFSDLPQDLRRAREGAELTLRYRIGTDGLVSNCRILVSSGRPDLDAHTCAYITERFRFRPARDSQGRAVPYTMTEIHGWDQLPG